MGNHPFVIFAVLDVSFAVDTCLNLGFLDLSEVTTTVEVLCGGRTRTTANKSMKLITVTSRVRRSPAAVQTRRADRCTALKTPRVADVTFALSHFTHTSALASAFSTFAVYTMTTVAFSHFRTSAFYMFRAQGRGIMFKARASSPAAAGLVLPPSE